MNRIEWRPALLFAAVLCATVGLFGSLFWSGYRDNRDRAAVAAANLAGIMASDLEGVLRRAEGDLRSIAHQMQKGDFNPGVAAARREAIDALLADRLVAFPEIANYLLIDVNGKVVVSVAPGRTDVSVADRPWFQSLRNTPGHDVVLSEVLIGRATGRSVMVIGMAVRDPSGLFIGGVIASLDLEHFRERSAFLDVGAKGVISVRRSDTNVLVLRRPETAPLVNPSQANPLFDHIRHGEHSGIVDFESPIDDAEWLYAFHVLRNFPLYVTVGIARSDYQGSWYSHTMLVGGVAVVLLVLLAVMFLRQQRARSGMAKANAALRQREDLLTDSEERFRATFEQAATGLIHTTFDGTLLRFNHRFCDIIGYPPQEVVGLHLRDVTHPEDSEISGEAVARLLSGGEENLVWEKRYIRKDGSVIWARLTSSLLRDHAGTPLHQITVVEDVTDRRRTERLLQARLRLTEISTSQDLQQLLVATLDEACGLTEGTIGFYHFLKPDQVTLTLEAWSTRTTAEFCKAAAHTHHYDLSQAGVWADCVRQRRSLIINDYTAADGRKGLPEGHAEVRSLVSVPVIRRNRIVAVLGVGNKPVAFDERDVAMIESLADMSWDIAERKRAEQVMAAEATRFQALLKTASDGIHILDEAGNLCEASESFLRMLGYGPEDEAMLNVADWEAKFQVEARNGTLLPRLFENPAVFETRHRRSDGTVFDVEINSRSVELDGRLYLYASSRDITDRKAAESARRYAEAELRATAARLKLVLETAAEGIFGLDDEQRVIFANRATADGLGWASPEALQGKALTDVFQHLRGDGSLCGDDCAIQATLGDGETRRVTTDFFCGPNGNRLPVDYTVSPLQVEGVTVGAVVVFHDVTERRQAEREIDQLLTYQRAILDNTPVGIAILDLERRILQTNDAFGGIFGRHGENLVGQPATILYSDREQFEDVGRRAYPLVRSGGTFCDDVFMCRRDLSTIWVRLVAKLVDPDNVDLGVVWAAIDMSERKALDEELRRSNEELERFAYVASHDLRQPLRMVSSYLKLIERTVKDRLTPDEKTFIGYAVDGAKRMDRMIVDLLDYSRIGRTQLNVAEVSLQVVMDRALANLQAAIDDAGTEIVVAPSLPVVRGSESELERLFQNLIGNAVKFRAPGRTPRVTVNWYETPHEWVVSIADNGIGISAEGRERLFTVFQRLVTREQYEGTGIGLASCRKIAEHHHGRIWVESEPENGSTFLVALPKHVGSI